MKYTVIRFKKKMERFSIWYLFQTLIKLEINMKRILSRETAQQLAASVHSADNSH